MKARALGSSSRIYESNTVELFDNLLKHDIFIILLRSVELLILRVNVSVPGLYVY